MTIDTDKIINLTRLLKEHEKRLQVLQMEKAIKGIDCPPHVQIEIEQIQEEVNRLKREIATTLSIASPSVLSPGSEISCIYTPETNENRNSRKREVIRNANGMIQLLATTGHSYLAIVGNRFKSPLINRLKARVIVRIILLNPWSDSGVFLAFGEFVGKKSQSEPLAVRQIKQGKLSGFDPVEFIENSTYYRRKLPESLEGYEELWEEYDQIELRFVDRELVATILLTDQTGFFEPYINVNLQERMQKLMHTFEIEFSSASYFLGTCQAYFDTLWKLSISYSEFVSSQEILKSRLRQKYQWN